MNYFGESIAIILSIAYYFNGPLQKCQVKEKKIFGDAHHYGYITKLKKRN